MEQYTRFYVDKTTQTFADTLVVFGLARLLAEFTQTQTISDQGSYYQIECAPALDRETVLSQRKQLMPIPAIETAKNADAIPPGISKVSYEAQRDQTNTYFEARRKGISDEEAPPRPDERWDIFRAINPASLPGYNNLLTNWWAIREAHSEILLLMLALFSNTPNDYDNAFQAWNDLSKSRGWQIGADATCQQLYNPDQGKGHNKTKSDGLSVGNLKGFWLVELLKAVGFYEAAMTRLVRGAKDRKTFVLAPRELTFAENSQIMATFTDKMQFTETSTRFDILAAIRYMQALLQHFQQRPGPLLRRSNIRKRVVAGFHTAFYKDLGNAVATMNLSFIALPGWVTVSSAEDIALYIGLLNEMDKLVRQFDESHSDAFILLQYLRDFMSGDDLDAFFCFTNAFPAYYMGMKERGKYAYRLDTESTERLIMSTEKHLTPILESVGFQNIAYAIRQSTVTAQYRKQQGDRKYDVRYGLGQELARKARYPTAFITALADFLHRYNAENAQVMETRPGPYRRSIQTGDLDEIVRLIDSYGSETVANLLIAYGYARQTRDEIPDEETEISEQETQE